MAGGFCRTRTVQAHPLGPVGRSKRDGGWMTLKRVKGKDLQVEGMFNIQVQEVTFRIKN